LAAWKIANYYDGGEVANVGFLFTSERGKSKATSDFGESAAAANEFQFN